MSDKEVFEALTKTPASLALSITAWNLVKMLDFVEQQIKVPIIPWQTFCYATVDILSTKTLTGCSKDCHLPELTNFES